MENNQKPIIVTIEELKIAMANAINVARQAGVPFYLIETIMANFYTQVKYNAQNELAQATAQVGAAETAPNNTK